MVKDKGKDRELDKELDKEGPVTGIMDSLDAFQIQWIVSFESSDIFLLKESLLSLLLEHKHLFRKGHMTYVYVPHVCIDFIAFSIFSSLRITQ